ncbi:MULTISPECIES: glycosyltransferase [unclassified Phormidesmis]
MVDTSLIMTVYNREQYLSLSIESVLTQTDRSFEFVIWDDGSTDQSLAIAQFYAAQDDRIRLIAAPHTGRVDSLIKAIALSTGTYLGLVDSDDLLAKEALEQTKAILDSNSDVGLVYSDYVTINAQGKPVEYGSRCQIPYSRDRLLVSFMVMHFRLMRRSLYDQVGGFNPEFEFSQDYDLILKLSEVTDIHHLPQPLYFYRYHQDSIDLHRQIQKIICSYKAAQEALVRRGLSEQLELTVELSAQVALLQKSGSATEMDEAEFEK